MFACMRLFCEKEGLPASCYVIAHEDGLRAKDSEAFRLVCKRACESGADPVGDSSPYGDACADYGFEEKDPVRSADAFEKACNWNNARGCTALGLDYREGLGRPKDEARARVLLSKGCDLGEDHACKALGRSP
jgi:TPR repeat protein